MRLVRAVCEHFVAPGENIAAPGEDPQRACTITAPGRPPGVALLCDATDASVLGAALGLVLAREQRSQTVAVCLWTGGERSRGAWRAPALPAARRLAGLLGARGQEVRAAGRLVMVRLPDAAEEAATAARRVAASAGRAPTVLALGGPWVVAFDELLADQDLVVVAPRNGAEPVLARLAVDGLASKAMCACACEVPPTPCARALAAAGLLLLPSARRALEGPIAAMA